ncbi:acyl-CoA thioesterase [Salibacteraceae bacterium]|jgi:acyl-CoA thioester hydrolase|nr:thioesterase [Crocinitomicaceae bacterium]MCH9822305.1 acyl-CoA thioesterase [Bacteroidota bacterium]MDA9968196.1 acyl-CoA thioesterase [Salibacteraceae bacterium]MDB0058509.1 acyl-CoA thioesterase [Salibacteraceae bacterium]|tara:strand:+ start:23 stop:433 length:411 start_codon:yes stop_codon:yes gene_type:complete
MYKTKTTLRVRYAETDRMSYVYYGNYGIYFEVARVEAMKQIGMSYKDLEDSGIMMPVLEFNIKYFKPAFYDDELIIETRIEKDPGVRIRFDYETFNSRGEHLNSAFTTLVFVNTNTGKPVSAPDDFLARLKSFKNV